MATKKSLVKNTSRVTLKGNAGKSKKHTAKAKTKKRNPTTKMVKSKRKYKKNSAAGATAGLLAAFGGALVISLFDAAANKLAPSSSGMLRTIGKFGLGFLVGMYGPKIPVIKGFAPVIQSALYIAGALDVIGTYVMPYLLNSISNFSWTTTTPASSVLPSNAVATGTVTDPNSGQLGQAYMLPSGQQVEVYNNRQLAPRYGGYNPSRLGNRRFTYA